MATTSPARIDDDLYASAKLAGEVQSRSASQQVAHWARIGREIEASATISHKDIAEVLAGSRSYDSLTAKEQALVRAEWSTRMDVAREALNFAQRFGAEGRTWVELDDHGAVVERSEATGDGGKVVAKRGKRTVAIKPATKQKTASGRKAGGRSVG
jgi:hypothetical protein